MQTSPCPQGACEQVVLPVHQGSAEPPLPAALRPTRPGAPGTEGQVPGLAEMIRPHVPGDKSGLRDRGQPREIRSWPQVTQPLGRPHSTPSTGVPNLLPTQSRAGTEFSEVCGCQESEAAKPPSLGSLRSPEGWGPGTFLCPIGMPKEGMGRPFLPPQHLRQPLSLQSWVSRSWSSRGKQTRNSIISLGQDPSLNCLIV